MGNKTSSSKASKKTAAKKVVEPVVETPVVEKPFPFAVTTQPWSGICHIVLEQPNCCPDYAKVPNYDRPSTRKAGCP